jgi:hypothetical protein
MRSFFAHRFWVIFLAVLAVVALLGLAIGLRNVSFREAQAFGRNETVRNGGSPIDLITSVMAIPWQTQMAVWVLFVLMFVLIGFLLSPEIRKRLIRIAVRVALTYWGLYILFTRYREVLAQIGLSLARSSDLAGSLTNGEPPPVFIAPPSIPWLSYLVSFVVIAILLIFLVWKLNSIWRELNTPVSDSSMQKLAKIARSSLHDLSSGRESSDVILNCYYRMSDVISDKKNIERRASMTPNEFAVRLEQAGLPADAVKKLTRLFESVRYGGHRSDSTSVNEAVACLTTILHACGETV